MNQIILYIPPDALLQLQLAFSSVPGTIAPKDSACLHVQGQRKLRFKGSESASSELP